VGRYLVTGGASGIGAAVCEELSIAGHDVVSADVASGSSLFLDVCEEDSWEEAFDTVGRLDGLVNCAGVVHRKHSIIETEVADFDRVMRVNVTGTWLGIRAFFRRHDPESFGSIVNIASVNATIVVPEQASYAASKGAVVSLTKAAAIEGASLGIRANAIGPGPIRTPMTADRLSDPQQVAWFEQRVPLGRVGEPDEVAQTTLFLLSDAASYITGTLIYVDGGWTSNAV
tara:strand:- start:1050 stop:1736 length:687 start_codon:yes stop_codon:yes gene_type:complete